MSTLLGSMLTKLLQDWGTAAAGKLSGLLAPLFHRKDGEAAIEDRDTRITFVWDAAARSAMASTEYLMASPSRTLQNYQANPLRWERRASKHRRARRQLSIAEPPP